MAEEVITGLDSAKEVQRNKNGQVQYTQQGTDQVTNVTSSGAQTLSVSNGGSKVMYDKLSLKINTGSGSATIKRDGSKVTSVSIFADGTTLTASKSPRIDISKWTGSISWQGVSGTNPGTATLSASKNKTTTIT